MAKRKTTRSGLSTARRRAARWRSRPESDWGPPLAASGRLSRAPHATRAAFTLVEILIVVTIMAIMAGAGITAMEDSATDAKDSTLAINLRAYRVQIELFKAQHDGHPPGWTGTNPTSHLRLFTNALGTTIPEAHPLFPYGPYIPDEGILNPFNSGTALQISTNPAGEAPNPALKKAGVLVGWFYDSATGRIAPNAAGSTSTGILRISQ